MKPQTLPPGTRLIILTSGCLWGKPGQTCTLLEDMPKRRKCRVKSADGIEYIAECDISHAIEEGTVKPKK